MGPFAAEGLDFLADMGETNDIEFGAVLQGEAALRPMIEEWRHQAVLNATFLAEFAESIDSALSTGADGVDR